MKIFKNKQGYIVFYGVIIAGAVVLATIISMGDLSDLSIKNFSNFRNSKKSFWLTDACSEIALEEIKNNPTIQGSQTINFPEGDCSYEIINNGGQNRQINSQAEKNKNYRKIKIEISQIQPQITISNWEGVSDF